MRRLINTFALSFLLLACAAPAGPDTIVYKTKTGEKYHKDGCGSLWKSKIAIKLADAKADGLTACKKCKP